MKNITNFFEWNSIENQYSPEFIKNTRCVKFSENEGEVTVLIASSSKDKKEFADNYKKFEKFFKETYVSEKVDFSVFDTLRKDSAKKTLQGAISNFEKYYK